MSPLPNHAKKKKKRVQAAVIGGGDAFRLHALGYRKCTSMRLRGVFSPRHVPEARELGIVSYPSFEAVLSDPEVDAIDITTPSSCHAEMALEAMRRGKHVLVEKPVDVDPVKARQILDYSHESGLVAAYVSQFRFSSGIEQMKELLEGRVLGDLACVNATLFINRDEAYYLKSPWRKDISRSGGGVLLMNGIHLIDTLIYLIGIPKVVSSKLVCSLDGGHGEIERLANVVLEFSPAVVANIHVTGFADRNYPTTFDFVGTRGRATLSEYNIIKLTLQSGEVVKRRIGKSYPATFAAQLDDFGNAIRTGRRLRTPIEDGIDSLNIVLEAYRLGGSKHV